MYCTNCGKEINDLAVVCVNCGHSVEKAPLVNEEKLNGWLVFLAVLIPLFGFIYWPLKYKETPKTAKACGIAAIISFIASFILSFIFSFVVGRAFFEAMNWFLYEANI